MADVLTINEAVARSKEEGIPITAYCLRSWIRSGELPVRKIGSKNLIYWPNLVAYMACADGGDNRHPVPDQAKIRPVY